VYVWKRVLTEMEVRQLQCDPFAPFAYRQAVALLTAPASVLVDCAGSIMGQSAASAIARVTRDLASSAHVGTSISAILQVIRSMLGTIAASATLTGMLTQMDFVVLAGTVDGIAALQGTLTTSIPQATFGAMLENERFWSREALFNGMTSVAFKLGTVLTGGWFWTRRQGCTAVYRGAAITQMDFSSILYVTDAGAKELSLPAYLSHAAGRTYCYLVRRFNGCGYQEQTANAAVVVRIAPDGHLEAFSPSATIALKGEQIAGKLRLAWFYCPLDQKVAPEQFNVYWNDGAGPIDYKNPVAMIPYKARQFYCYQSGMLAAGRYVFATRAEGVAHVESGASAEVTCQVNDLPPETPLILIAETT